MSRASRGGGRGAKPGRGHGRKKSEATGLPSRSGEVGACVELGNNIYTLGVNSKSKDGDKLLKTSKAVAIYIGRHFGDELQKEFEFGKKTVRQVPTYDVAVVARHAVKVQANSVRLTATITSLGNHLVAIEAAITADPMNLDLVTKKIEIEEKIASGNDKLLDVIDIDKCMTGEEAKLWDSAHRSYREDEQKLVKDSGKVYALILGQCTQVLLEACKFTLPLLGPSLLLLLPALFQSVSRVSYLVLTNAHHRPQVRKVQPNLDAEGAISRNKLQVGDFLSTNQFVCHTPGRLPSGYGQEKATNRFNGGTIYNDAASGLIWVENQVSLGANETIMGKERFEQWIYDHAFVEIKHYHGDNGVFSIEEYCDECTNKMQSQSFLGVGAQHQNSKAERAIQTIMYMAHTFMVHSSLHWTDMGADDISLWPFAVKHAVWLSCLIESLALLLWN